MPLNSILQAYAHWRHSRMTRDPSSNLEETEAFILGEIPTTVAEAACILEVICAYGGDVRCDGLDHAAMSRVRTFLTASA